MQTEGAEVVWRTRNAWEAADLGVHLLQHWRRQVYFCYLAIAGPLFLAFAATGAFVPFLPALLMWWSKPWLDRTILFVLSRAVFGASTAPADVWQERAQVWGGQLLSTLTLRRLTASRAFTQPVLQLEGLRGAELNERLKQITAKHRSVARAITMAFLAADFSLFAALFFLAAWLAPHQVAKPWGDLQSLAAPHGWWFITAQYAAVVLFVEPLYVAAGFGAYLNRRVALEAWDVEQEFRRVFA